MKKLLVLSVAITLFSCNSNEKGSSNETPTKVTSNLELAKSTIDQIFLNAEQYEDRSDSNVMAPYGSKLSIQLDSLKSKLTEQELKEFNQYANKKFEEEYPQS